MNNELGTLLKTVLSLKKDFLFEKSTQLLGHIPEFDSLAVVAVIETIEDQFDIVIDDDEIDAEIFETFGSLLAFVELKVD